MVWSYLKRGISTDYEDLLWKMHTDYVNDVKKPCCRLGQTEHMETNVFPVAPVMVDDDDHDNRLIMVTAVLVVGLVVWNCK
jgi:hypothetical protein